ncbi:hypothetical protein BN2476_80131 [Paraburkholderia piptadeniae]|uniref:Uncharacterized protein n=1 Tax=Paraburkholderia piptadeniae TaxID=1701573 RepID=A0A1N7RNE4_9BURK|nr:hypothetical protein BN2476_80131 [Paraburkholderia piptadeniae]
MKNGTMGRPRSLRAAHEARGGDKDGAFLKRPLIHERFTGVGLLANYSRLSHFDLCAGSHARPVHIKLNQLV